MSHHSLMFRALLDFHSFEILVHIGVGVVDNYLTGDDRPVQHLIPLHIVFVGTLDLEVRLEV